MAKNDTVYWALQPSGIHFQAQEHAAVMSEHRAKVASLC